jgi:hypothetical protein
MKNDKFEKLLADTGPCLTSELVNKLVSSENITRDTARKRISRFKSDDIKRIRGLFPRNEIFIYHRNSFGSYQYWQALISRLINEGSAFGRALVAIRQYGGVVPYSQFEIICGSPLFLKKHLSQHTVLEKLEKTGLVSMLNVESIGKCISLKRKPDNVKQFKAALNAQLMAEKIILNGFSDWVKNIGLVSYEKVLLRNNSAQPNFLQFSWDFTAPSYIGAIIGQTKSGESKPGFIVADIILNNSITAEGCIPFLYKCKTTRCLPNASRCMQFLIAENFNLEAFKIAKKNGILPVTTETLFGKDIANAITLLISILTEVGNQVMDLKKLNAIFSGLSKFEGAVHTLRGDLFEYLVANVIKEVIRPRTLELNYEIKTSNGQKAEIDVYYTTLEGAHFIECKGYSPFSEIPDDEIEKWLHERIPRTRDYCLSHPDLKQKKLTFELWTTGKLSFASNERLITAIANTKKYTIKLMEASDVRDEARKAGRNVLKTLNNCFLESTYIRKPNNTAPNSEIPF